MTIRTISTGTAHDFTTEELEALRREEPTSAILNDARHRTGDSGRDVAVRGHGDVGLERQLAENKAFDFIAAAAAVADAVSVAGGVGTGPAVSLGPAALKAGAVSGAIEVLLPIGSLLASQYGLSSLQATKNDTRDAATRDVMRGAMLLALELPSGYVDSAMPRDVGVGGCSPAKKIGDQLKSTALGATLQLHCDHGIGAAEDFLASRCVTKEQFFGGRPRLSERYENDPAFQAGFDALVWAVQNAPEDYSQMIHNLRARDARYAAANVRVSA